MKPLEEMGTTDVSMLLAHGNIVLADGRVIMKVGERDIILRSPEGDLHFKWFHELVQYIALHGAAFKHTVVDAEDARQQRIVRRLEKNNT